MKAGHPPLVCLHQDGDPPYRLQEHIHIKQEANQRPQRNLPPVDEIAAEGENDEVDQVGEEVHPGKKLGHDPEGSLLGTAEITIIPLKFLLFVPFVGKGFDHPHTGDAVFYPGIDIGYLQAHIAEGILHLLVLDHGKPDHHRDYHKRQQGQLPVDGYHNDEGSAERHRGNEEIFGPVMGQLRNLVKIVNQAGHDVAGFGVVKVAERELLNMVKEVLAHIILHAHTEDMAPVINDILEQRPQQVEPQQAGADTEKEVQVPLRQDPVDNPLHGNRENQVQPGHGKSAAKVDHKERQVRPVIFRKTSQQTSWLL